MVLLLCQWCYRYGDNCYNDDIIRCWWWGWMIVTMVLTAGKQNSRFGIIGTSDIVCLPLFTIKIKTGSWGRLGMCLGHGRTDRQTDKCCLCPQSFWADLYQRCFRHIALPHDTAVPYRMGNVTRFKLLHFYTQPFSSGLMCGTERHMKCASFLHETVSWNRLHVTHFMVPYNQQDNEPFVFSWSFLCLANNNFRSSGYVHKIRKRVYLTKGDYGFEKCKQSVWSAALQCVSKCAGY